jgi:hypothetical protein
MRCRFLEKHFNYNFLIHPSKKDLIRPIEHPLYSSRGVFTLNTGFKHMICVVSNHDLECLLGFVE